ncbi:MAG: hypothetical protein ABI557_14875 [Aureliella sp.]
MSAYKFETPYPSSVTRILLTQYPRVVVITFTNRDVVYELRFVNPQPLSEVVAALDDCYQFRVIDVDGQLEFGRYRVEIWDEDNSFAEFTVDSFEQIPVDTVPTT